jgi:putative oxidoreductase
MHALTRWFAPVTRVLLGLTFVVFGLNGFLHFIPMQPMPGGAGQLIGALAGAGYFFPLLKATEIAGGLALLTGRFVPLGLTVLAPIVVNIAAFHFFLTPGSVGMSIFLLAATAYLGWAYRDAFRPMLAAVVKPRAAAAPVQAEPLASAAE